MSNRTGLYAALAAAGVGGYYLYRAGGDPKAAKQEIKHDADVARNKVSTDKAEKTGQKVGAEAGAHIDEAVANARTQAQDASNRASGLAHESLDKLNDVRQDAAATIKANVDKFDKTVEQKTSEAKGSLSSWWSGSK
ncbi:hypothetical protein BDV32DRAFT_133667 [Aspergillus pseudonomiae]|uniref:Uncharacterized protein n=1 Tax=Aspergillus pseudonomiae TaxID=1506151 RepID=A0A5N7CWX4_9EURO|nr:uncharacterized protein BDV37DRAFT_262774 [Aspergillus pseudonomiae]KAB8253693.1 hypothetical protein BDV32DRAFT_133667 [Aspergillus pseudonomiae]KAE8398680.1 hypothetical protein BDV37DRAFT_262774 [Aspergillus pseudonomiae]